jgi:hypothetical protein
VEYFDTSWGNLGLCSSSYTAPMALEYMSSLNLSRLLKYFLYSNNLVEHHDFRSFDSEYEKDA